MPQEDPKAKSPPPAAAPEDVVTVRYQVADVERAASFYRDRLGFQPTERAGSAFGAVTRGALRLILSGPGSSGFASDA